MKNIFEVLNQKEQELRELRQKLEPVEREVEALRTAVRLLADEKDQAAVPVANMTQTAMIIAVLKDRAEPMHVKEISEAIEKRFKRDISPSYIAPVIHRHLGKRFTKAADRPNTFGLIEWSIKPNPNLQNGNRGSVTETTATTLREN
jgi:recombinational DNA repair protein RecR